MRVYMRIEACALWQPPARDGGHELPLTLRKNAAFKAEVHGFLERYGNCDYVCL